MKIVCMVRQVPDSRLPVKVLADGSGIEPAATRLVCDPFDEFGVAWAVQAAAERGDVEEVAALSVGPGPTTEALRHALAMGATRAVAVVGGSADEMHCAALASAWCKREGADLVLCGKQCIETDSGVVGPALAEMLGRPHVGAITAAEWMGDGSGLTVRRRIEGGEEVVRVRLPAVLTCEKGLIEPKQPPLPRLMKAKKAPIEEVPAEGLGVAPPAVVLERTRLTPPPPRPPCRMLEGDVEAMAAELVRLLRDEAGVL